MTTELAHPKNVVMIVDDNPNNLGVIFNVLDEANLEVLVAQDGESALQKLDYTMPDLILLDIMMPGIDGFETCKRIKNNPKTASIPVIFMTAVSDTEHKVRGLSLGAVDYITKPFQKEEVLSRIQVHLDLANVNKTLAQKNQLLEQQIQEKEKVEQALQQLNQELEERVRQRTLELQQTLRDLQQAQLQLIQSEKISTLGQLVAGVAHELNNPIGFILGNAEYAETYVEDMVSVLQMYRNAQPIQQIQERSQEVELDYVIQDLPKVIKSIKTGSERIRGLSNSLTSFCLNDNSKPTQTDIHVGIDSVLLILQHRFRANENRPAIELIRNYGELPLVSCYPSQINQVFMNLITHAIDTLEESNAGKSYAQLRVQPNRVTITTTAQDKHVVITIKDNGPGMDEELRSQIFDYLFTTKIGKIAGLGLSISRQIVEQRHAGQLLCLSSPGRGTEFQVTLPVTIPDGGV